jgi:hypothetical protein
MSLMRRGGALLEHNFIDWVAATGRGDEHVVNRVVGHAAEQIETLHQ